MRNQNRLFKNWGGGVERFAVGAIVTIQLVLVFLTQATTVVCMDGIFSYTLSNNPYHYLFIDVVYDEFPNHNGWINAHNLKENYAVEPYDRFNYSAVYYHQRRDVHPPLYYFAVHTISSLFPGKYSNLYTMGINLSALLLTDLIMIKLFKLLYGKSGYGVVPIAFLLVMKSMRFLFTWPRMYMMLFLFCAWFLYIHAKLLKQEWRKADLIQMIVCIFLGTLTHYYFYIYAGALVLFMLADLLFRRQWRTLVNYLYCGIMGIAASWIFYPWVLWHVFVNDQNKHADIAPWNLERVKEYALFLREQLFNDRAWTGMLLFLIWIAGIFAVKRIKNKREEEGKGHYFFRRMALGSGLLYSFLIYTLDGGNVYYITAFYVAYIVWASMVLLDLINIVTIPFHTNAVRIGIAVICIWILYSGAVPSRYISTAEDVAHTLAEGRSLKDDFHQVPERYGNYNCLYIEKERDTLLQNYWFEFGEYKLFKKISLEEFRAHGIRQEELAGCGQEGEGIVVYAPKECEFDERDYRRLADDAVYAIYEYTGEKRK